MLHRFAEAGLGSLLNKNSLIHDFKIITGIFITTSDSSFGISTLLNLVLDPFEGSLDTVLALLHNSVTGGSPSESSCKIDAREILPSLMFLKNL